ncbi:MAG: MFS transporter [Chloroflexota bacterium]|nr:MFS transporter [Chloroflexota bacterium]
MAGGTARNQALDPPRSLQGVARPGAVRGVRVPVRCLAGPPDGSERRPAHLGRALGCCALRRRGGFSACHGGRGTACRPLGAPGAHRWRRWGDGDLFRRILPGGRLRRAGRAAGLLLRRQRRLRRRHQCRGNGARAGDRPAGDSAAPRGVQWWRGDWRDRRRGVGGGRRLLPADVRIGCGDHGGDDGKLWAGGAGAGTNPRTARLGAGGLFRDRAVLLVAGITCLGFFLEGIMETWSVIYLRASLELPVLLGASGAAVFHLAMLAGRLTTAGTVHRLGRHGTLRGAGMLAALGMTVALATERPPLILAGFLTVGLALAGVAPVAFSLAGDLAPDRAGQASSVLTTLAYGGFLLGPSLIGGVAELTSLRAALMSGIVTGLLIALLSARVDLREGVNEAGQA